MTYEESLEFLFTKLPMYQRVGVAALKFDLNNITNLMDSLGNPHNKLKTIHIAGTNGKGSSAHMIASIMQEAGYKTGLYTSPHLRSFTERIRVNGTEINKSEVVSFVERIKPAIERIKPSFFEITFAMAMVYFRSQEVDIAIIEVGLGGRLDSTNIILPEVSLITNISFDHQHLLGNTLEEIASEKAGIIKQQVPLVINKSQESTEKVFRDMAIKMAAKIIFADKEYTFEQAYGGRLNVIRDKSIVYEGLLLDLKGQYQIDNLPGVLAVITVLSENGWSLLNDSSIRDGLSSVIRNTGLKGRWQLLGDNPMIIADTGHNEAGVLEIVNELSRIPHKKLHMVWGMVKDKVAVKILKLLPQQAIYYFTEPNIPRALKSTELIEAAKSVGLSGVAYPSVQEAINSAKESAAQEDLIFIGGSTFVVAEIDDI